MVIGSRLRMRAYISYVLLVVVMVTIPRNVL